MPCQGHPELDLADPAREPVLHCPALEHCYSTRSRTVCAELGRERSRIAQSQSRQWPQGRLAMARTEPAARFRPPLLQGAPSSPPGGSGSPLALRTSGTMRATAGPSGPPVHSCANHEGRARPSCCQSAPQLRPGLGCIWRFTLDESRSRTIRGQMLCHWRPTADSWPCTWQRIHSSTGPRSVPSTGNTPGAGSIEAQRKEWELRADPASTRTPSLRLRADAGQRNIDWPEWQGQFW